MMAWVAVMEYSRQGSGVVDWRTVRTAPPKSGVGGEARVVEMRVKARASVAKSEECMSTVGILCTTWKLV